MLDYNLGDVIFSPDNQIKFSAGIENANLGIEVNGPIAGAAAIAIVGIAALGLIGYALCSGGGGSSGDSSDYLELTDCRFF